jgi:GDP-mannose 6-dehydrogenase
MRVSVFGLSYLGYVSAACLARDGHTVIGADVESREVSLDCVAEFPGLEPGLDRVIAEAQSSGKFRTTLDARSAVLESDVSLICVGTCSNANGSLNLRDLDRVCVQIGTALAVKDDYHLVVVRSAVLPGTVKGRLTLLLEQHSDRQAGDAFGICMNPAFEMDCSGAGDFDHPSQIVIGELDARSGDTAQRLYKTIGPIIRTSIQAAEMLNYVNSAFHAVKVAFANEIGNLCASHGIDGQEVMEYCCLDRRLNLSSAYLKPGFAFGGPSVPNDLRALLYRAKEQDIECPLLSAVLPSNQRQIFRAIELVEKTRRSRVGILGLGFKAGTADIRDNPIIQLIEMLIGKGYQLRIFDENIDLTRLTEANTFFLDRGLPHIVRLISPSIEEVIEESEVVVVASGDAAVRNVSELLSNEQILIDVAGVTRCVTGSQPKISIVLNSGNPREGIC